MSWVAPRIYALGCAVQRLARRPGSTLVTLMLTAIAIAVPLGLATLVLALQPTWERLSAPAQAVVFLSIGTSERDIQAVTSTALALPGVTRARHVPRDTALAELAQSAPGAALPQIKVNPLPDVVVVHFAPHIGTDQAQASSASLRKAAKVDIVQFDADTHRRWSAATRLAAMIAAALGVLTVLVAIGFVVVAPRTLDPLDPNEREVLYLFGAEPGFADRPAAYAGALLGGTSALLAVALLAGGLTALAPTLAELRAAWGSDFAWSLPAPATLAGLVVAIGLIGLVAGYAGSRRFGR